MSNNLKVTRESVQNGLSSIFTKEDVIKILDGLSVSDSKAEENLPNKSDLSEYVKELYEAIDTLEEAISDLEVDSDDISFSIDGRYISVDEVNLAKGDLENDLYYVKTKVKAIAHLLQIKID